LSEEELRAIIRTANLQGVLDKQESEAHQNLFRFSDQVAAP
jgi:putative hemolysin